MDEESEEGYSASTGYATPPRARPISNFDANKRYCLDAGEVTGNEAKSMSRLLSVLPFVSDSSSPRTKGGPKYRRSRTLRIAKQEVPVKKEFSRGLYLALTTEDARVKRQ